VIEAIERLLLFTRGAQFQWENEYAGLCDRGPICTDLQRRLRITAAATARASSDVGAFPV
jgi:hypothetical protein